jgi:hypothetical protein
LRYTYRGERESLQGQLYRIEKKPTGIEAHKQIPIEGE